MEEGVLWAERLGYALERLPVTLGPAMRAVLMSLSTIVVAVNALLRRVPL
jgi:hypothetical protein